MMPSPSLVDALVDDLRPTRRARPLSHAMFAWCAISWCLVAAVIMTLGPLREGVLDELLKSPRLAIEVGIGLLAGVASMVAGLELGVPGSTLRPRLWSAPLLLFGGWILVVLSGLLDPTLASASAPMRAHCFLETLLVSLPSATAALYLLHGRILFTASLAGLMTGAAAAAVPVIWMELACMTEPIHALQFHLSAILLVGATTALLAHRFRVKI